METINHIVTFNERPDTDAAALQKLQNGVMPEVEQLLRGAGYSETRYDAAHSTLLCQCGNAPCLVMFAEPAATPMEINALSEEQCKWAEEEYPAHEVRWTTLFLLGNEFLLMEPLCVRENGEWKSAEDETAQYLPQARFSEGTSLAKTFFGGAYMFKLVTLLSSYLASKGKKTRFCVTNLFANKEADDPYAALYCSTPPGWILQLEKGEDHYTVDRPVFYHCDPPYCKLELEDIRADYRQFGLVELMHPDGRTYVAECLEAAVLRDHLPLHRCYQWSLSMVAESLEQNDHTISLTEGAFYEMQKEGYRQEHGCEPPDDFSVTLSMAEMRTIFQDDKNEDEAYSSLCGVVRKIEDIQLSPMEFRGGHCVRALVSCFPDEEQESLVSVYLPDSLLAEYTPAVGDRIICGGTLLVAPDELCDESESLQDNPDVGEAQDTMDRSVEAQRTLYRFEESSLGLAIAAAAFVRSGWQIEHVDADSFSRRHLPLAVANQRGDLAVVFVDTIVNGHQPAYSVLECRSRIEEHYLGDKGVAKACYFCTIHLDYNADADRYKVSMTMDPPCEGVQNTLIMTAPPNRQSILNIEDGVSSEKPLRPEKLDEAMVARLFRDAMAEGKWKEFARWIREESEYTSDTMHTSIYSKIDYLRYMTERVEDWKHGHAPRWPYFRFSVGTVLYNGERRPCMATYYVGILSAVVVFDDAKGLIGRMRTIDRSNYCTYIEGEKPRNVNELRKSELRGPARNVKRPPYAATKPVDITHLPADSEHRRILLAVLKHLERQGTPAVGHPTASAPFPHIWFRRQDMSLCYVIFGPVDEEEEGEGEARLDQLKKWVGCLEYENLKQLSDYRGYMAFVTNDGEVALREIPKIC